MSISKMGVKMNLRIITKNHAADPEIGFLTKSISKPNGCATAMPTAWESITHFPSSKLKNRINRKQMLSRIYLVQFMPSNSNEILNMCQNMSAR